MSEKTITLTGSEVTVTGLKGAHAHIRNDGADTIFAAKRPGISAGSDGTISIPAGQADTIRGISGTVYLLGTGSALIQSDDYVVSPFKTSAQAGGSGADDVARAAISTHSGNTEIHVTAAEKASWNSKADPGDIPASLPANGGNSDTVGGRSVSGLNSLIRFTYQSADINALLSTGVYCGTFTNYPEAVRDGQGTLIVINYFNHNEEVSGTIGADILWLRQLFISAHGGQIYERTAVEREVSSWTAINNGGDAATLETHPASDFALKADLNALALRVTALENA